jgi:hypothetical protein
MTQSLAACVRLTTKQNAVWRRCRGCTALAPLAPDATHCRACLTTPHTTRRQRRAA